MQDFASGLLVILALSVAVPTAVLCLEIIAGTFTHRGYATTNRNPQMRVAVIVPARNENAAIASTLGDIKPQLLPSDILFSSSPTIALMIPRLSLDWPALRSSSATTFNKIGKGYAFGFGVFATLRPHHRTSS